MMKKLLMLAFAIAVLGAGSLRAQSKKEVIEKLTHQTDSLKKVLTSKAEASKQQEIKIAKLEGAVEANNQMIKRLETKSDSLGKISAGINATTIDSLKAEIGKFRIVFGYLKSEEKAMTVKNDSLQQEVATLKQKLGVTQPAAGEALVANEAAVKEETKAIGEIKTVEPTKAVKETKAVGEIKVAEPAKVAKEATVKEETKTLEEIKVAEPTKVAEVPAANTNAPAVPTVKTEPK